MTIASHMQDSNINGLIRTGSPISGRRYLPGQIDFVYIPVIIKKTKENRFPFTLKSIPSILIIRRKG